MSRAKRWFVTFCVLGMMGVSIMMNFRFGFGLGREAWDAWAYGLAGSLADCIKPVLPLLVLLRVKSGEYLRGLATAVLFVACVAYSTMSGIGFAALNRADTAGERAVKADSYQRLQRQLRDAEQELGKLRDAKPTATVAAEMAALLQEPVYRSKRSKRVRGTVGSLTGDCSRRSRWGNANARCSVYRKLKGELASGARAESLRGKIGELNAQLGQVTASGRVTGQADPQVSLLQHLTGLETISIQIALSLATALLVELVSGWGLFVLDFKNQAVESKATEEARVAAKPATRAEEAQRVPTSAMKIPDLRIRG